MLQFPSPAEVSPACSPEGGASVAPTTGGGRLQEKRVCASGTKVPLLPELCPILALCINTDFSSAFLACQVYIHHPKCLFNPIRAVFIWGLDLSLMSA